MAHIVDSILYYNATTKPGDLGTVADDFSLSDLRDYVFRDNGTPRFHPAYVFRTTIYQGITPLDGFGLWIRTRRDDLIDTLWDLPFNLCRVQLDEATGKVIRRKPTLAVLRTLQPDPVICGRQYTFPTITDL